MVSCFFMQHVIVKGICSTVLISDEIWLTKIRGSVIINLKDNFLVGFFYCGLMYNLCKVLETG